MNGKCWSQTVNCSFLVLATVGLWPSGVSAAGNGKLLHSFTGGLDGGNAATAVVFDGSGNAYGTTVIGGSSNCGTVFRLTPKSGQWRETVLYSFSCFGDGKNPHGGVTLDRAGNLYGTTVAGGSGGSCAGDGCGVVFELTPAGEKVLYNFTGGDDGFGPGSAVVFDEAGNLYGTAPDGGPYSSGVVYELSPSGSQWHQHIIHSFTGGADGGVGSLGALHLDARGNVFGVAEIGGLYGAGTAYELSPSQKGTWNFTALYEFKGTPDAGSPYGGLTADAHGNLYGTTYYGGAQGVGSVYRLTPNGNGTWAERVLYSFKGGTDGSSPTSTLIIGSGKDLYGTTSAGGYPSCDCGTIFKLQAGFGESIVHRFGQRPDGAYPYYGLTLDANGNLYGATVAGGFDNQGIVFELIP